jgi:nucleotide-binding universal stress UspA family protein
MPFPPKTIVALIDLAGGSEKVIAHAKTLAQAFSCNVVLMHGVPKQPTTLDVGIVSPVVLRDPTPEEWESHKARLLEISESLQRSGINATAAQVQDITGESVVVESKYLDADLIIVGSHHHSALLNLFLGNITQDVLKHALCPVLVIPADEKLEKNGKADKAAG